MCGLTHTPLLNQKNMNTQEKWLSQFIERTAWVVMDMNTNQLVDKRAKPTKDPAKAAKFFYGKNATNFVIKNYNANLRTQLVDTLMVSESGVRKLSLSEIMSWYDEK